MKKFSIVFIVFILLLSCKDDDMTEGSGTSPCLDQNGVECVDLTNIEFRPNKKELIFPPGYQPADQPLGNEMTDEGVLLGRHLFYDPILSADSTMSCSSCHGITGNFTDNLAVSPGIDGIAGKRSAMPLVDLIYAENIKSGLFWDGRTANLETQALLPIEDPIELHDTWENVEAKLQRHENYPRMFREAFGIQNTGDITKDLASKAIAQFERSLITMGNSKFDKVKYQNIGFLSESARRGFLFFFDEDDSGGVALPDAECAHCHSAPLFTDHSFRNNGLTFFTDDSAQNLEDKGRYEFTQEKEDIGLFRVPTLRNIEFSAPYMHDGRFETLEEVLDHYTCGVHQSPTLDVLMVTHCDPANEETFLDEQAKKDIIEFMKSLSDTTFFTNPDYQSPF